MERQFLKFIKGCEDSEIDWDKFVSETRAMAYSSVSRIGRSADSDSIEEISSLFIEWLLENKSHLPISEETAFSKLKRFAYEVIAPTRVIGGFDETIESETMSYVPKKEMSKKVFYEDIEKVNIHPKIKKEYLKLIDKTPVETLFELCERKNFLGQMLMAFLLRKPIVDSEISDTEDRDMFSIKEEHDNIYLACLLVKLGKAWPMHAYILWGNTLFSSMASFMSPVLIVGCERYFKNLFVSIRVFLNVEHYKKQHDEIEAYRESSWALGMRLRDIMRRHQKVSRILDKYEDVVSIFIKEMEDDYTTLFGVDNQQISFDFLLGVENGKRVSTK